MGSGNLQHGILVPQNRVKPTPPAPEAGLPTRKPLFHFLKLCNTRFVFGNQYLYTIYVHKRKERWLIFFDFCFLHVLRLLPNDSVSSPIPGSSNPSYFDVSFPGWNGCDPDSVTSALPWPTVLSGLGQSLNSCPN